MIRIKSRAASVKKSSGNKRAYDSTSRRAAAQATRGAILDAARALFSEKGYAATTMPAIAEAAGIALDTVYASVGKKPALFSLLIETAISGSDIAVPAEERDYVRAIRNEPDPSRKLAIYAAALRSIQERLAPLFRVLQQAAPLDASLAHLWNRVAERRASNMRLLAQDLAGTGRLRPDVPVEMAADILWSMNSPEYYLLLVEQRGWTPEQFEGWLSQAWRRLLLESDEGAPVSARP
jgi:AcrR family transcriptional regulator